MNILVLSWRDPKHPLAGGAEQVMHEHMKGWIEEGHSVTFFSSLFPNASKEEALDGVKIIRKGSQYLTCHVMAFFWYLFGKHRKFDLVVDEFHGWPFFTPLYVRKPKLAVIQELTRDVWFKYSLPYGLRYILGAVGYVAEPLFFLFYKDVLFMTGSESAERELLEVGVKKKNIAVVPHGVIFPQYKVQGAKRRVKTVMFLGALARDKGIEDAIRTFGILNKMGKFQFWVVGRGDSEYLRGLKKLSKEEGVEKKVRFFGFVSQEKKFELLVKAHVVINPSIREGWGLVNIEANAMCTPVVAYKSPGLVDSVKDRSSGMLCEKNSPEELAKNVGKLLSDKRLYNSLSKGALRWSRSFSWKRSRKLSLNLLEKLYMGS